VTGNFTLKTPRRQSVDHDLADPVRLARGFLAEAADLGFPGLGYGHWGWTCHPCGRGLSKSAVELAVTRFVVLDLEHRCSITGDRMPRVTRALVGNVLAVMRALASRPYGGSR
jgi:hypothetical protein